jgi:hypothetical protein
LESIQATFKAGTSAYHVDAGCRENETQFLQPSTTVSMRWSSQGFYDPRTGIAREDISVNAGGGHRAAVTTTLSCPSDPWLGPPTGPGMVVCANPTFGMSGGDGWTSAWLQYLQEGFYSRIDREKESSLPNSTGFAYDRAALIAQRNRDVAAEQKALADAAEAALQKKNRQLKQAVKPAPAVVAPVIVAPPANALYMRNNTVPIRILAPPGMTAVSFMVKLERRDSQGNWGVVTTLPVSAAEATSPAGYTGWGTPGNGRDPSRMVSLPGGYRISAQVFSPRQTGWSQPVEFSVTTPNKAIQRAPKAFGQ